MNLPTNRRLFLRSAAATTLIAGFPNILHAQGNTAKLKIGLIGCGGRGTGAADQALSADPNVVLWAVADAFSGQITNSLGHLSKKFGGKVDVAPTRQFVGIDAYQKLLESGVDVVLLASPPGFRPLHLRAAVEAGKHIFAEKPMAVDVTGVKSVMESARLAKEKNITIQHGFCWRFAPNTRAGYDKVTSGELGRVISVYGTYMGGVPKPTTQLKDRSPDLGDVEWQVRNWMAHEWLSGGPLLEQAIHTVDKIAWAMNDVAPIAARGGGGRTQRSDDGDVWDHYEVTFEYPNEVLCHIHQRQMANCFSEVKDRVYCEKGILEAPDRVLTKDPSGKVNWAYRGPAANMYQVCHNEWFEAIRKGLPLNTGEYMANSTMLGILGREAAHSGQRITWEQLWNANQNFATDGLKMSDKHPTGEVAKPGQYKLV